MSLTSLTIFTFPVPCSFYTSVGSLTDSGYPRVVKEWARGTSIQDSPIVFEGEKTDVAVNAYVADERIWGGDLWQV